MKILCIEVSQILIEFDDFRRINMKLYIVFQSNWIRMEYSFRFNQIHAGYCKRLILLMAGHWIQFQMRIFAYHWDNKWIYGWINVLQINNFVWNFKSIINISCRMHLCIMAYSKTTLTLKFPRWSLKKVNDIHKIRLLLDYCKCQN